MDNRLPVFEFVAVFNIPDIKVILGGERVRIRKSSPNERRREGEIRNIHERRREGESRGMPPSPEGAQPTRGEVASREILPTD